MPAFNEVKPRPHARRYPWDEWFAKGRFIITQGLHFDGMPHAMAQQVRNTARRMGKRVKLRIEGNTVQVYRVEEL